MNAKRTANLIVLHRQNRSCGLHSLNLIRRCVCKKIKDAAPSCICLHDIGIDKQVRRWPTINDADLRVWVPINGSSIQERLLHGQKLKAEICEAQFFYHRPLRVFCLPDPVVIRFGVPTHTLNGRRKIPITVPQFAQISVKTSLAALSSIWYWAASHTPCVPLVGRSVFELVMM